MPDASPFLAVVLLDDAVLADDLFVRGFGRMLAGSARRLVLVHGDGGTAGRALEAAAVFDASDTDRADGRALAAFALNRRLAAQWSDAGAVVTGLSGEGRAILRADDAGALALPGAALVRSLVAQGVIPLVAARAARADGARVAADPVGAVAALAHALGGEAVAFLRAALPGGPAAAASAASDEALAEAFRAAGQPVRLLRPEALLAPVPRAGEAAPGRISAC